MSLTKNMLKAHTVFKRVRCKVMSKPDHFLRTNTVANGSDTHDTEVIIQIPFEFVVRFKLTYIGICIHLVFYTQKSHLLIYLNLLILLCFLSTVFYFYLF